MPKMPIDHRQLSMFPYLDQAAILWFPTAKRRHVIRGVARRLLALQSDRPEKVRRWRVERDKFAGELRSAGLDAVRIELELERFFEAVDFEMWRLDRPGQAAGSSGEGAA